MSKLLSLPAELVLYILLCLPASSIQICQRINKYFNILIRNSVTLQYIVALGVAKAEDNAWSTLSKTSKLKSLQASQDAWDSLQASFVTSVPVGHRESEVYNLSSEYFFLGDINDSLLHFLRIPTMEGEEIKWKAIRMNNRILRIGLAAFEHDLIALVTRPLALVGGTMESFDIKVELRELSTNAPHRLAQNSTLYVMRVEREEQAVHIDIVGQHLVIIVLFHRKEFTDRVFIFDWKNNVLKASFEAGYLTYENLLFLSEDLIILPNTRTGALDVFRIPLVPLLESLVPIVSLALPALTNEYILDGISCQCAPNPVCPTSIPDIKRRTAARAASRDGAKNDDEPQRGWRAKAQDALCIFGLSICGGTLEFIQLSEFEFVVHRNALMAAVEHFELANTTPSTPHKPVVVQWGSWGAGISSWDNSFDYTSHRIAGSAGQRLLRMPLLDWDEEEETGTDEAPFIVLDYNQTRVSTMRRWLEAQPGSVKVRLGPSGDFVGIGLVDADRGGDGGAGSSDRSAGGDEDDLLAEWIHVLDPTSVDTEYSDISQRCTEDWRIQPVGAVYWAPAGEMLQTHGKIFAEPIVSALPYIARVSKGRFRYTEMAMDEERVIGIHSNNETGCIEQLEIHHFG